MAAFAALLLIAVTQRVTGVVTFVSGPHVNNTPSHLPACSAYTNTPARDLLNARLVDLRGTPNAYGCSPISAKHRPDPDYDRPTILILQSKGCVPEVPILHAEEGGFHGVFAMVDGWTDPAVASSECVSRFPGGFSGSGPFGIPYWMPASEPFDGLDVTGASRVDAISDENIWATMYESGSFNWLARIAMPVVNMVVAGWAVLRVRKFSAREPNNQAARFVHIAEIIAKIGPAVVWAINPALWGRAMPCVCPPPAAPAPPMANSSSARFF